MSTHFITRFDAEFSDRLHELQKPPDGIWVRGEVALSDALNRPTVAIVGSRVCTDYGAHVARTFANTLARAGVGIVSGLARGIDGHAHRGCLEAHGTTIAVLGGGIDRDYPAAHGSLAEQIRAEGGLMVSEYEPGIQVEPWRLLQRNRIIAALAEVLVVIESRENGGAIGAAHSARLLGRPVLAVPGQVTSPTSRGSNKLIHDGLASVCLDPLDVLAALQPKLLAGTETSG